MVRAGNAAIFQFHTAGKPPDSHCVSACLEPKRQGLMTSYINPGTPVSPALTRLTGRTSPGSPYLDPHKTNGTYGLPPYIQDLLPTSVISPIEKGLEASRGYGGNSSHLPPLASGSYQRKFLIFDRSKNETSIIFGSPCPPYKNQMLLGENTVATSKWREQLGVNLKFDLNCPIFEEESDENYVDGEESEMHEDTEEINALLYSDDDEDDDDASEDDDVTSTGHTPSTMLEQCGKRQRDGDTVDEVVNSNGPNKRQKLLGGGCTKLSPLEATFLKLDRSNERENGTSSSFSIDGELSKKDKIRQTLKILEHIVPGAKGKDPVVILDGAIDYLRAMKLKAQVIGMNFH